MKATTGYNIETGKRYEIKTVEISVTDLAALRARVKELEDILRRLDGDIPSSTIDFYVWLAELRRAARAVLETK